MQLVHASYESQREQFQEEFERFRATEKRRGNTEMNYRIHWSGDIPDAQYAAALADAMMAVPDVRFWGYTRSMFSVPIMAGIPNVRWYISADALNLEEVLPVFLRYLRHPVINNINLCYMGREKPDLEDIRLFNCPVDVGKMDLDGACHKCKACLEGVDVFFKLRR